MDPRKLLIVSHDAGAGEILSAWAKLQDPSAITVDYLLEGPALKIFKRKCGVGPGLSREQALAQLTKFDWILTGTSWGSDLEKTILLEARKRGLPTTAFLDHWSHYRERFQSHDTLVLPSRLWVGDEHALEIALATFGATPPVELVPNPYFDEVRSRIKALERDYADAKNARGSAVNILYVSEPISDSSQAAGESPKRFGYDEFDALRGYLSYLKREGTSVSKFRLRPHPAEAPEKYLPLLREFSPVIPVELSQEPELARDCAWADWVVGCDSMAMVVGLLGERQVYSCIPEEGAALCLPHPEIKRLFKKPEIHR